MKYCFFSDENEQRVPAHVSRPLTNTVRTPHRKLCLGNEDGRVFVLSAEAAAWRPLEGVAYARTRHAANTTCVHRDQCLETDRVGNIVLQNKVCKRIRELLRGAKTIFATAENR